MNEGDSFTCPAYWLHTFSGGEWSREEVEGYEITVESVQTDYNNDSLRLLELSLIFPTGFAQHCPATFDCNTMELQWQETMHAADTLKKSEHQLMKGKIDQNGNLRVAFNSLVYRRHYMAVFTRTTSK